MSLELPQDRPLAPDDPALHPGWRLLEFLLVIGADEFAVRFLYCGEHGKDPCDRLARGIAFASQGERTRECTVTFVGETNPRPIEVWRLDRPALEALRDVMPSGVLGAEMGSDERALAWAEDLCVYRRGQLLFGTVTHERIAFLRVSDAEWEQWEAQVAADHRAT
ncbi:MAG TPA: hypothetical protein VGR35_20540 [Tepidisphaeraceae bacterium]|nr:hypothetical protein [Tepidisphaeraceae bacterium]